jgi:uncharacterized short protein YbdD (DUF466 family)
MKTMRSCLHQGWSYIRRVSGDDAYEHYLAHHHTAHANEAPLSRQQFYLSRLEQKSRGVNRCC